MVDPVEPELGLREMDGTATGSVVTVVVEGLMLVRLVATDEVEGVLVKVVT
jgi:hypothetical protein